MFISEKTYDIKIFKHIFNIMYFRELLTGTLKQNNLMDGSNIIIIPNVETGLLVSSSNF